jgi:hypothetical protein
MAQTQFLGSFPSKRTRITNAIGQALNTWMLNRAAQTERQSLQDQREAAAIAPELARRMPEERQQALAIIRARNPRVAELLQGFNYDLPPTVADQQTAERTNYLRRLEDQATGRLPAEIWDGARDMKIGAPGPLPERFRDATGPADAARLQLARDLLLYGPDVLKDKYIGLTQTAQLPSDPQMQAVRIGEQLDPSANVALQEGTRRDVATMEDRTKRTGLASGLNIANLQAAVARDRMATDLELQEMRQTAETAKQVLDPADRNKLELATRSIEATQKAIAQLNSRRTFRGSGIIYSGSQYDAELTRLQDQLNQSMNQFNTLNIKAAENAQRFGIPRSTGLGSRVGEGTEPIVSSDGKWRFDTQRWEWLPTGR